MTSHRASPRSLNSWASYGLAILGVLALFSITYSLRPPTANYRLNPDSLPEPGSPLWYAQWELLGRLNSDSEVVVIYEFNRFKYLRIVRAPSYSPINPPLRSLSEAIEFLSGRQFSKEPSAYLVISKSLRASFADESEFEADLDLLESNFARAGISKLVAVHTSDGVLPSIVRGSRNVWESAQ